MSKYIELSPQIMAHESWLTDSTEVNATLSWLDEHPDQVPGRAVTESELRRIAEDSAGPGASTVMPYIKATVEALSITIVPEPTNAEKWVKFCSSKMGLDLDPWQADVLDKAGVKAPEGES